MTAAGRFAHWLLPVAVTVLTTTATAAAAEPADIDAAAAAELETQALAVAARFAATLQPRLLEALQRGGAVHAIGICAKEAPAIAASLSKESGWRVSRVSLRPRNPGAAPDQFQQQVLQRFDAEVTAGSSPVPYFSTHGDEVILLVPQLTVPLCLTCHGEPTADVAAALREHYPHDVATGYVSGQVRGALSLRKAIEAAGETVE